MVNKVGAAAMKKCFVVVLLLIFLLGIYSHVYYARERISIARKPFQNALLWIEHQATGHNHIPTDKGIVIKAGSSQTGDLVQIINNNENELISVDKNGAISTGPLKGTHTTIYSTQALQHTYNAYYIDATSNDITVTLPTCSNDGEKIPIKRIDASSWVVTLSYPTIDGQSTVDISKNDSLILHCVGTVFQILASHIKTNYVQQTYFNNSTPTTITTKNEWVQIDGFTDIQFNGSNFLVDPAGYGIIPLTSGFYRASYFLNYVKALGANNVQFEICTTEDGVCYGDGKVLLTAISNNKYDAASFDFFVPLIAGRLYGQAVRNTTNTDDIIFVAFSQSYQKI